MKVPVKPIDVPGIPVYEQAVICTSSLLREIRSAMESTNHTNPILSINTFKIKRWNKIGLLTVEK